MRELVFSRAEAQCIATSDLEAAPSRQGVGAQGLGVSLIGPDKRHKPIAAGEAARNQWLAGGRSGQQQQQQQHAGGAGSWEGSRADPGGEGAADDPVRACGLNPECALTAISPRVRMGFSSYIPSLLVHLTGDLVSSCTGEGCYCNRLCVKDVRPLI